MEIRATKLLLGSCICTMRKKAETKFNVEGAGGNKIISSSGSSSALGDFQRIALG
jgi:hypothetical protein